MVYQLIFIIFAAWIVNLLATAAINSTKDEAIKSRPYLTRRDVNLTGISGVVIELIQVISALTVLILPFVILYLTLFV